MEVEIGKIVMQMSTGTKEAKEKRELVEILRATLEINERLKAARESVRRRRLRFVWEELRELKKVVRDSDEEDNDDEVEHVVYGRSSVTASMSCFCWAACRCDNRSCCGCWEGDAKSAITNQNYFRVSAYRRFPCYYLCGVFAELPSLGFIECTSLTGHNNSQEMRSSQMQDAIAKFKDGCSRGRARKPGSGYILMVEREIYRMQHSYRMPQIARRLYGEKK